MAEKSKYLGFVLRLTTSLVALGGLVYALRGKLAEGLAIIRKGISWEWFVLAVAIYGVGHMVISRRFQNVLRVQGVKLSFLKAWRLSFLGLFFNLFFPSALGGDVVKAYYAYQYSGKKLASLTGVILDRLLGFATIVVIALSAVLIYSRNMIPPAVVRSLYGAVGLLILGILFFTNHRFAKKFRFLSVLIPSSKWRETLANFYDAIRKFRGHKGALVSCLALSVVAQVLFFLNNYCLSRSLGIHLSVWNFFVLIPLVFFVSMAPSVSGLGVREAGFVFFFKSLVPVEQAFALSLLYDFLFYGVALLSGVVFALKGGLKREWVHDVQEIEKIGEVSR